MGSLAVCVEVAELCPGGPQQSVTIIRKYPGHTFIFGGEKKNAKKSDWGSESAAESGQFKGEENWRIALVNFTSFRSISFNFIPFHPVPGGPRPQGGGWGLSGQNFSHLADLFSVAENSLDSQILTFFLPRRRAVILYFIEGYLLWVIEAHGERLPTSLLQAN